MRSVDRIHDNAAAPMATRPAHAGRSRGSSTDAEKQEERDERVAETWILAGGSWKKRPGATSPVHHNINTTASSSPAGSRLVGGLPPPRRARSGRVLTAVAEGGGGYDVDEIPPPPRRRIPRDDDGGSSFRSKASSLQKQQQKQKTITTASRGVVEPAFARSSSGLSAGTRSSHERSVRTSQTEPARSASPLGGTAAAVSSSSSSWCPHPRQHGISEVMVVEDENDTNNKTTKTKKKKRTTQKRQTTSPAWLREKDDFFSATRHSESVKPPPPSRRASPDPSRTGGDAVEAIQWVTATPSPATPPRKRRSASPAEAVITPEDSFHTVGASNTTSQSRRERWSPPPTKKREERQPEDNSQTKSERKQPEMAEGWATGWKEEDKKKNADAHAAASSLDPLVVDAFRDTPALGGIPPSVRAQHLRRERHRRHASPTSPHRTPVRTGTDGNPGPDDSADRTTASSRGKRITTPTSPSLVPVLTAEELLAEDTKHHDQGQERSPNTAGLPLSHVTAIRQCFGFDCDIYKDVLQVGRNASDRQLRIAYFRRGRNVLAEHQRRVQSDPDGDTPEDVLLQEVTQETKETFQAISLAYEIIHTPVFRVLYDEHGWDAPLVDVRVKPSAPLEAERAPSPTGQTTRSSTRRRQRSRTADPRGRSMTPILRPAVGDADERRSRSTGRGIRWSDQVEELVFRQDPEELEARRVRSPEPDPGIFDDEWMPEMAPVHEPSFMANFLSEVDQSLDGLEASLDGFMKRGFEEWSLSSKGSKDSLSDAKKKKKNVMEPERRDANSSPIPHGSSGDDEEDQDTVPSKLSEDGQDPTAAEDQAALSEEWNATASVSSTLPSSIHSAEDSEDVTVKQLFKALTQTTDDRRNREDSRHELSFKVVRHGSEHYVDESEEDPLDETRNAQADADRSSPSDVRKMPTEQDEVHRAFSDLNKEYSYTSKSRKDEDEDIFDPFNDSVSTLNIGDGDFGSSANSFDQIAAKPEDKDTTQREPKKTSKACPVIVEDVTSVASSPERRTDAAKPCRLEGATLSLPNDNLFSEPLPEFRESPSKPMPLRTQVIDTTDLRRAKSDFSSLTGTTGITYNTSVKTDHVMTEKHQNLCAPIAEGNASTSTRSVVAADQTNESREKSTHDTCDMDFLSHLFCYTNALSSDLNAFGSEFSSKISATRNMIMESLTFSDDEIRGVVTAMEMPRVEKSSTM